MADVVEGGFDISGVLVMAFEFADFDVVDVEVLFGLFHAGQQVDDDADQPHGLGRRWWSAMSTSPGFTHYTSCIITFAIYG
jgi:hypothetical protein